MTADEIRRRLDQRGEMISKQKGVEGVSLLIKAAELEVLAEIAAQLAEINERESKRGEQK